MKKHQIPYLTHEEMKRPLKNIVSALKMIHGAGYLHNDVQPPSLLVERKNGSQSFKIKLGGFAKVMPQEFAAQVKESPASNLYRAPEVHAGEPRSPASDVWSLGVTLYVMSTGRFPFKSKHAILNNPVNWTANDVDHLSTKFI